VGDFATVTDPPPVTPESREMLADFGELMYEIQLFEFTLAGIVQVQEGEVLRGSDQYGPFLEKLFSEPSGKLRKRARIKDKDFADLLERTVTLRNRLVHGWLIYAGMDLAAGVKAVADERKDLRVARGWIHDVRIRLDALYRAELDKLPEEGDPTPEKITQLWREGAAER
jgi:hypothetical protein